MSDAVRLEIEKAVAAITLNRPQRLNAFDLEMTRLLLEIMENVASNPRIRVVVLRGEGKAFCAGADLHVLRKYQAERNVEAIREVLLAGKKLFLLLRQMPQAVIASVNGPAVGGGCSLALNCDWRIAAQSASFSQAFIRIGLHPDWGGYLALPALVGAGKALELMLTAETVAADRALQLGLVNQVVADEMLGSETAALASRFAQVSPLALAKIKQGVFLSQKRHWEEVLDFEVEGQIECLLSEESRAAVEAFLDRKEKRGF